MSRLGELICLLWSMDSTTLDSNIARIAKAALIKSHRLLRCHFYHNLSFWGMSQFGLINLTCEYWLHLWQKKALLLVEYSLFGIFRFVCVKYKKASDTFFGTKLQRSTFCTTRIKGYFLKHLALKNINIHTTKDLPIGMGLCISCISWSISGIGKR